MKESEKEDDTKISINVLRDNWQTKLWFRLCRLYPLKRFTWRNPKELQSYVLPRFLELILVNPVEYHQYIENLLDPKYSRRLSHETLHSYLFHIVICQFVCAEHAQYLERIQHAGLYAQISLCNTMLHSPC